MELLGKDNALLRGHDPTLQAATSSTSSACTAANSNVNGQNGTDGPAQTTSATSDKMKLDEEFKADPSQRSFFDQNGSGSKRKAPESMSSAASASGAASAAPASAPSEESPATKRVKTKK